MRITYLVFFILVFSLSGFSQHKKAYTFFTSDGKEISYNDVVNQLKDKEIILFGEQHNSAIAHWLQLEITKYLAVEDSLVLGAEMFEADNQEALTSYLSGEIDQKGLDTLARLWVNYKTDYKPLVDISKNKNLTFIATNIPRRYANLVYKNGFEVLDTLSEQEKKWIAPLPIPFDPELPTYQNILEMMGDHGTPELVKAQAIKDATMAHFILENKTGNTKFIHYNGAYHSDYYEGILWYLKRTEPDMKYGTLSTVTQKDISFLEKDHFGKADFIIVVDENVTKTY
ncbi:MAG: ChaN family lipoprotein [Flavobacteriaceae bacterium]